MRTHISVSQTIVHFREFEKHESIPLILPKGARILPVKDGRVEWPIRKLKEQWSVQFVERKIFSDDSCTYVLIELPDTPRGYESFVWLKGGG